MKDGLSQSTISSICQDREGFMWFGTANGLDRYDGYSFNVYKTDFLDSTSISNNIINYITEDENGVLWIATENGLNSFDKQTGKFKRYLMTSSGSRIMPVLIDHNKNMWIGGYGSGLIKLNRADGTLQSFPNDSQIKDNSKDYIWSAAEDDAGNLLLGTLHGLVKFDPLTEKFSDYPVNTNKKDGTSGLRLFSILKDNGCFWIGSDSGILDCFNPETGEFKHYPLDYAGEETSGSIYSIIPFDSDRLLVGIMGSGIKIFNKISGKVEGSVSGLTDNRVYSLYMDKTGIIWGGTYTSGINKINPEARKFRLHSNTTERSPGSAFINCFYKDEDNITWIGKADGLYKYDPLKESYTVYKITGTGTVPGISSIAGGSDDNLWIGGGSGLFKFNKRTGKFINCNKEAGINSSISRLFYYKNNLLLCTRGEGIIVFDPASERKVPDKQFEHKELSSLTITSAAADADGLWLGSADGIIKLLSDGTIKSLKYESGKKNTLNSSNILSLCFDGEALWIGTYGGGLNRLDKDGTITWFSERNGLPDNVVYAIQPDNKGYLWISSNKGISRFNTADHSVKNFDLSDGLQGLEYNGGASFKSADGEMFFGGLEGWNSFYPERITENEDPPLLSITDMRVFDNKMNIIPGTPFKLSYDQNFISFDFVALHYHNPWKNKYAYMLKGFDKEWIYCGSRRFASYTNLEPGEYIFLVKGSNNDGIWNEQPAAVSFIIAPPFWRTWWFYIISVIAVTAAIVSIHKYRVRLKLKQLEKIEEIRKGIADDFHDELGHKLTKISLYSEIMRRELSGTLNGHEEYLQKINDAANNLYDDTKDFVWSIDPLKDSLFDLAVYLKDFGDEFFEKTGISFIVNEIPEGFRKIVLPMNWKRQLTLIFKEAMNNILKHSGASEVTLLIESSEGKIKIILKDNGIGFKEDDIKKTARGLDIMKKRAVRIGGLLEIVPGAKGMEMCFTGELKQAAGRRS